MKVTGNPLFSSLVVSFFCLLTIIETSKVEEVLKLIEVVNEISVAKKYLLLIHPTFDSTAVQNLTINFQIMVNHGEAGELLCSYKAEGKNMFISGSRVKNHITLSCIG